MATTLGLTKVFTPPTSCLNSVFTLSPSGLDVYQNGTVTRGIQTQCYPSSFRSVHTAGTITGSAFVFVDGTRSSTGHDMTTYQSFYSPGICPSGYATATVAWNTSTFRAACCPSGYSLGSNTASQTCTHTILADFMTLLDGTTNQTLPYPATAVAAPVLIAYAASDSVLFATATATQSAGSSSASPGATSATITPTSSTINQTPDRQLTTGAQAGIGVGVSIGALLLIAGVVLLWLRRRRNRNTSKEDAAAFEKAELSGVSSTGPDKTDGAELEANNALYEKSGEPAKPPEMDTATTRSEMMGDLGEAQAPGRDLSVDHRHEAPP